MNERVTHPEIHRKTHGDTRKNPRAVRVVLGCGPILHGRATGGPRKVMVTGWKKQEIGSNSEKRSGVTAKNGRG